MYACIQTWFSFLFILYIHTKYVQVCFCLCINQVYDVDRWFSLVVVKQIIIMKKKTIFSHFIPNFCIYYNMKSLWVWENPIHYIFTNTKMYKGKFFIILLMYLCLHTHTYYMCTVIIIKVKKNHFLLQKKNIHHTRNKRR